MRHRGGVVAPRAPHRQMAQQGQIGEARRLPRAAPEKRAARELVEAPAEIAKSAEAADVGGLHFADGIFPRRQRVGRHQPRAIREPEFRVRVDAGEREVFIHALADGGVEVGKNVRQGDERRAGIESVAALAPAVHFAAECRTGFAHHHVPAACAQA